MIIRYKYVSSATLDDLEKKVNDLADKGWRVFGPLVSAPMKWVQRMKIAQSN